MHAPTRALAGHALECRLMAGGPNGSGSISKLLVCACAVLRAGLPAERHAPPTCSQGNSDRWGVAGLHVARHAALWPPTCEIVEGGRGRGRGCAALRTPRDVWGRGCADGAPPRGRPGTARRCRRRCAARPGAPRTR